MISDREIYKIFQSFFRQGFQTGENVKNPKLFRPGFQIDKTIKYSKVFSDWNFRQGKIQTSWDITVEMCVKSGFLVSDSYWDNE